MLLCKQNETVGMKENVQIQTEIYAISSTVDGNMSQKSITSPWCPYGTSQHRRQILDKGRVYAHIFDVV